MNIKIHYPFNGTNPKNVIGLLKPKILRILNLEPCIFWELQRDLYSGFLFELEMRKKVDERR